MGSEADQNAQLFMIISIISWLALAILGWTSLGVPDIDSDDKIWIFWNYVIFSDNDLVWYEPLFIYYVLFYFVAIITLIFITAAFLVLCMSYFVKKDENVISGMLGTLSKFHFIPILCACALFIIGYTFDEDKITDGFKGGQYFMSIFFGVVALGSLIFIHLKTNIESPVYATWIIKHGAYGCLIALLFHHIGYAFSSYGVHEKMDVKTLDDYDDLNDWRKGCYIAFSIIIGLCNIGVSLFLKEIIIPFINLLIYIGLTVQFYKMDNVDFLFEPEDIYSKAPGIINIIMMVLSLLMVCFLGFKMRQT